MKGIESRDKVYSIYDMGNTFYLSDDWENITEIIPFGYGRIGRRVMQKLQEHFDIPFVIDNNPSWNSHSGRYEIIPFAVANERIQRRKIVVTTTDLLYLSIKEELEKNGYVENVDFCVLSHFIGEWFMKYKNLLYISKIDTIITSRCTLPCPHCAMFIHCCERKADYPLEGLCKNFDVIFNTVDYIMEYSLFGGEPLIYADLDKLIDYLMSKYGEKIGRLVLISNGNARPSDDLLDVLAKYRVMLSISDYTHKYDYSKVLMDLLNRLDKKGIEYSFNDELIWKDIGYPSNPANVPNDKAREHFKVCGHSTFCINNGILYFCDAMFGAEINTGYNTRAEDVVNIREYISIYGKKDTKERILRYIEGDINELGCPSFCQLCRGVGCDNNIIIEAGS